MDKKQSLVCIFCAFLMILQFSRAEDNFKLYAQVSPITKEYLITKHEIEPEKVDGSKNHFLLNFCGKQHFNGRACIENPTEELQKKAYWTFKLINQETKALTYTNNTCIIVYFGESKDDSYSAVESDYMIGCFNPGKTPFHSIVTLSRFGSKDSTGLQVQTIVQTDSKLTKKCSFSIHLYQCDESWKFISKNKPRFQLPKLSGRRNKVVFFPFIANLAAAAPLVSEPAQIVQQQELIKIAI